MNDKKIQELITSFIKEYGLINHIISSMNDVYDNGIPTILSKQFKVKEIFMDHKRGAKDWRLKSSELSTITLRIETKNVKVEKPTIFKGGKEVPLYPGECKKKGMLYGGDLKADFYIELEAMGKDGVLIKKEPVEINDVVISKIPIVVKSNRCNIEHATPRELEVIGENPNEGGGYLVKGNNLYLIDSKEKVNAYNRVNTYYEKGLHKNILSRSNVISKSGIAYENSFEFEVTLKTTGHLTVNLNKDAFNKKEIPYFLLFRLLNVCSDKDMFLYIIGDFGESSKKYISYLSDGVRIVDKDFEDLVEEYNPVIIRKKLAKILVKGPNSVKFEVEMIDIINNHLFSHMKTTEEKLIFLGYMIRKTIDVIDNQELAVDRDSLDEKLVEPPGLLFGDTIKKTYNKYFMAVVKKFFENKVHTAEFDSIEISNVFNRALHDNKLQSQLVTTLSSGNADNNPSSNTSSRYSTQKMYNTPDLSQKNVARVSRIASSAAHAQSTRTNKVRFCQPTFCGYFDMTQTHDTGDHVGKVKNLAITCIITVKGDSYIGEFLKKDVLPLTKQIDKGIVFLNGEMIGLTDSIYSLQKKYISLRRERKINRFTGIHVHSTFNTIDFRTDASRMIRPLLIVYNTIDNPEMFSNKKSFEQKILFDVSMFEKLKADKINIDDLCDQKVVEWIDCREQSYNTLVANSFRKLDMEKNNDLLRYTHCDIMAAIYGVACGTQPNSNHNPNTRTCFQAKMAKQALGRPTLERKPMYKDMWVQHINSKQLTKTYVQDFVTCSGNMLMLSILPWKHNQEDSLIANSAIMDRGCFHITVDDILEYQIEQGEVVGTYDESNTDDIKYSNYGKLKDGIISKGSYVEKNDIIISKRVANKKGSAKRFCDRSIVYRGDKMIVVKTKKITDDRGDTFIKILVRQERPLRIGDKCSSCHGQKGIISKIYPNHLMPYTKNGMTPDIIMGPHAFPTRKTMGQLLECVYSKLNSTRGVITDHTAFTEHNIRAAIDNLKKNNFNFSDKEVMYDGITGIRMEAKILLAPCYYQRIHKSIYDSDYAAGQATKNPFTRQPQQGAKKGGGIRFGEMEQQALAASGSVRASKELHTDNSDPTFMYICKNCGSHVNKVNEEKGILVCLSCDNPSIVKVKSSYTTGLVMNIFSSMDTKLTFKV